MIILPAANSSKQQTPQYKHDNLNTPPTRHEHRKELWGPGAGGYEEGGHNGALEWDKEMLDCLGPCARSHGPHYVQCQLVPGKEAIQYVAN